MLVFIMLFLFLALLVSILLCRDNKLCMQLLFVAYFSLIFVFLFLSYTSKIYTDRLLPDDGPIVKFLLTESPGPELPDTSGQITEDQLNEQEKVGSLKPLDFTELDDNLDEIVKPDPKTKIKKKK